MAQMKSVQFDHYGEPTDVLTVREQPVPEPAEGEARVRIVASPVNPSELSFVRGHYASVQPDFPASVGFEGVRKPDFPASVGFEGVGIVETVGPQVQGLVPGQRVAAINAEGGNWAEYAVVPEDVLFPVPDDIPDEQVACFFVNPVAAILMLRHVLAVPKGEWLLQSAATSELGRMIIRLAKHDGIRTMNIVRRREAAAELERLGADAVIVSTEGPIDEQVRRIVGPQGVKYAIDPVVGETGTQMYQALGDDGRMLVYGSLTKEPIRVGADPRFILAGRRILEVYWTWYWFPRLDEAARRQLVQEIVALMREGVLLTSIGRTFALDDVGAAVAESEATGRQGKVLLTPAKQ
jgi:NADPH:quinone reductase-like Zn-dependent oxidoreductase